MLRGNAARLGYPSTFTIHDADDSVVLMKQVIRDLSLDDKKTFVPKKVLGVLDTLRSRDWSVEKWVEEARRTDPWRPTVASILGTYEKRKKELGAMDFGELLHLTRALLRESPEVAERYQQQFRTVLVDEMQDTNLVQMDLLRLWVGSHNCICAVGDDDQSIYGWRGARVENMLEFERVFPGTRVFRMVQNYRSTQTILRAANSVIAKNRRRHVKELWTEEEQGEPVRVTPADSENDEAMRVVSAIRELCSSKGLPYRSVAVFFRTNSQSRPFEEQFARQRIPHVVVGGTRFYARAEVKDALSYLRTVLNPRDEVAFLRIVNTPPRSIGPTSIDRLRALARQEGIPVWDLLCRFMADPEPPKWAKPLVAFARLIELWRQDIQTSPVKELMERILTETGYVQRLEDQDAVEATSRLENLGELLTAMAEYDLREADSGEGGGLARYLEDLALITDLDLWSSDQDRVPLMTVHAAKGLEFDTVFITGMEERLFPHMNCQDDAGIEEERRLFYVALTRARKRAVVTWARSRARAGSWEMSSASRFLNDLDPETVNHGQVRQRRSFKDVLRKESAPAQEEGVIGPKSTGKRVVHASLGEGIVLGVIGQSGSTADVMVRMDSGEIRVVKAGALRLK